MLDVFEQSGAEYTGGRVLRCGVVPAVAVLVAMTAAYAVVGVGLALRDGLIMGSVWSRIVALGLVLIAPHLVLGFGVGYRRGFDLLSAVSSAVAPIVLFVVAVWVFGGPVFSPLQSLGVTGFAVLGWLGLSVAGMILGDHFTGDREGS